MSKLSGIVEGRLAQVAAQRASLVEAWLPYVEAATKHAKEKLGRDLNEWDKQNIAQCCENAILESGLRQNSRLFEATTADNISFLGVQLPVISALIPSLVLNELAIVQALDRRTGSVFYLDIQAGQAKGSLSSGDTLVSAKTGHVTSTDAKRFASVLVEAEPQGTSTSGTLVYPAPVSLTLVLTRGSEVFTETSAGILTSNLTAGGTGTINSAGQWTVTGWIGTGTITAKYQYKYDKLLTNGVPEVNINMTQEAITALDFPIRAKYSLGAAIDLEKAHGINLESTLVSLLGQEAKFTIDHYGIELIAGAAEGVGAATTAGSFNAAPSSGEEFLFKKYELCKYIEKGSNNIFKKTLRGMASYIVAGNNVAAVIKQMAGDRFKPSGDMNKKAPTGPMVIGQLDGRTVVQDPLITDTRYYLGYKGDDFLMAGFVMAPYIPLFSTPTLVTSDLQAQKGFLSAVGFKVINPGLFTYGDVTGV